MRSFTDGDQSRRRFAPAPSDYVDVRVLAAATAERHTIPTGAKYVVFAADGTFYAKFGDVSVTAAIAAADVTDGTGSEINPEAREIPAGVGYISLIASAATVISLGFFAA
jgi:hypothetical protein